VPTRGKEGRAEAPIGLIPWSGMMDKTFWIRFKPPVLSSQLVIATRAEIQGEHLVLLNSGGKLVALFLLEDLDGWFEVPS
jgi:hypothetical protein